MKKPLLLSAIALSSLMLNSCFLDPALELMKGEEKSSEQAQTLIEDMTKKVLDPEFEKKQVFKVSFSGVFKEKEETRSGSGSMIVNLKDSVVNVETNNTVKKGNTETKSHEKQEIYIKDNVLYTVDLEEKTYTTNTSLALATFNMQWQMSLLFTDAPYTYYLAENVIKNSRKILRTDSFIVVSCIVKGFLKYQRHNSFYSILHISRFYQTCHLRRSIQYLSKLTFSSGS